MNEGTHFSQEQKLTILQRVVRGTPYLIVPSVPGNSEIKRKGSKGRRPDPSFPRPFLLDSSTTISLSFCR